jgi:hypothetical protein
VLAIGNTTGANDIIVSAGQKIRTPAVAAQDGSSAITIANTTGALTLATGLADSNLATISTAGKVSNSATTATSANTASAIVARDASGNFTAGTVTAALSGNASTATTLQTARTINGVSFNGSADITVTAAAGTLTGSTLASGVTASSLTSVGTLANLTVTNPISGSVTGSSGSTTGNAATATALQTARSINGVSFNGTADITVTAAAGTLSGSTLASGVTASSLTSVGTLSSLAVTGDVTVGTSKFKVDTTNTRVGIGTESPIVPVEVVFSDATTTATNSGAAIAYHVNTDQTNNNYALTAYADAAGGASSGLFGLQFTNHASNYGDFVWWTRSAGGYTEKMRLDASGNLAVDTNTLYVDATNNRVGIGTTSPSGTGTTIEVKGATGDATMKVTGNTGGNAYLQLNAGSSGNAYINSIGSGALIFGANGVASSHARITSGGELLVGKTVTTFSAVGTVIYPSSGVDITRSGGTPLSINRTTDDGNLIDFYQAQVLQGNISVSGSTVSYNGGHLARWSQSEDGTRIDGLLKGTVLSNLDQMAVWINPETGEPEANEQLNCMKVSDVEGDPNVAGVFVNYDGQAEFAGDMNVAMTGDMIIRIAEGVTVQRGDLLMSAGDGTAKPQGDDIVRGKTIAKVTSTHVTCTYEDGSYCVPCVLMAC